MLRPIAHRGPSQQIHYITAPETTVQGTSQKRKKKDCKSQNTRNCTLKHSLLETATYTRLEQWQYHAHANMGGNKISSGPMSRKISTGKY